MTAPPVLSVSQVEDFDPEQLGGCPRRWWFERVQGHRPESTTAHADGEQGHALLARYLSTGKRPGRVRLGKAVCAVIDAGRLPAPGPHLRVEQRFSGQPHRDAAGAWVPLDVTRTLWHAGHPWEGFIDLRFRHRDGAVTVWDHKFSSDIHARALPAERLIRTVQMPIYALDSLRHWPDARAVNLVHLYVSRRGVESFIRHQRVSVEQVRERAEEIAGLVQQMDAVRGVTVQDDVPFNRAACYARTGCPHQFRCNAFRRKSMELTEEEKRMFGMLSEEKPKTRLEQMQEDLDAQLPGAKLVPLEGYDGLSVVEHTRESAERVLQGVNAIGKKLGLPPMTHAEIRVAHDPSNDLNLDDIFEDMPKPSEPKPQPAPTCEACGAVLTLENSSRLKTGDMKHIGCAKGGINLLGGGALTTEPISSASKCPDCPHPAHAGKPCEGKRGRGACRCGAAVEQPQRPTVPEALKHTAAEIEAQADDAAAMVGIDDAAADEARNLYHAAEQAKREEAQSIAAFPRAAQDDALAPLTRGGSIGASTEALLDAARRRVVELEERLQTLQEIAEDSELGPHGPWSGTLAVNVTVEIGPATLAFLAGLVKR